jgi:hypothetical protein
MDERPIEPEHPAPGKFALAAEYAVSLPERVVRSVAALAGGLMQEIGDVTLPAAVRRTKTYKMMVGLGLRFLVEQVGEVQGVYPAEGELANDFILRRTAGHGIELAGILAFQASPVWILAALADVSGAGRQIVQEIAGALQEEGLLASGSKFETIDQMLNGLEQTAGRAAEVLNAPPIDVKSLRSEWRAFRESAKTIPPHYLPSPDLLRRRWDELRSEAAAQRQSIFELSSLLALSSIAQAPVNLLRLSRATRRLASRTGEFLGAAVLDHYSSTLAEIHRTGYLAYWSREFRPYLRAAAVQFSPKHSSLTARMLRRKIRS